MKDALIYGCCDVFCHQELLEAWALGGCSCGESAHAYERPSLGLHLGRLSGACSYCAHALAEFSPFSLGDPPYPCVPVASLDGPRNGHASTQIDVLMVLGRVATVLGWEHFQALIQLGVLMTHGYDDIRAHAILC